MPDEEKPQEPQKRPRGRPRIKIDADNFKKLCAMQCTLEEVSGFFDCSEDAVEDWCKRKYKCLFSEIYKKFSAKGKISLRRSQFGLADKSAAMAIFLGKQYLGQRDIVADDGDSEDSSKDYIAALQVKASVVWNDGS